MLKRIFYIFMILVLAVSAALVYLGSITIPIKIRSAITDEIEHAVQKRVFVQGIRFDIFKGIVIDGIFIYDDNSVIVRAEGAGCGFIIPSALEHIIIIPALTIYSPSILLERRADKSFNLSELIPKDYVPRSGMTATFRRVILLNGRIDFIDNSLAAPFTKSIENVNADVRLSLPDKIFFSLTCEVPADSPAELKLSGEYYILRKLFTADVTARSISLKEFESYYSASGIVFPQGSVDADINFNLENNIVDARVELLTKRLSIAKDNIFLRLDSALKADARYDITENKIEYKGDLDITGMDIDGIDAVGRLEGIKARVAFDESRLSSENISVVALGTSWNARINLINYSNPLVDVYANSQIDLSELKKILGGSFNMKLPAEISGSGEAGFAIQVERGKPYRMNCSILMRDAGVVLGEAGLSLEHINGRVQFTSDTVTWSDLDFKYIGKTYRSNGALTNFASPAIKLNVSSEDLSFESLLEVNDKFLAIDKLTGTYLGAEFSVAGDLDFTDPAVMDADVEGTLEFDLKDLKKIVKDNNALNKAKPSGRFRAEFGLAGDIKNIKTCGIDAKVESGHASIYGFNFADITFNYLQEVGLGHVKSFRSSCYDGSMRLDGNIDWSSKDMSYSAIIDIKDAKLERFKMDTGMKNINVSGDIKLYTSLKGSFGNPDLVRAVGKIVIANGRLWQLNLFKGLGSVIFTSDFSDIVFTEGSCDFKVAGRRFLTNDFILKSGLLNIYGSGEIGFDKTVAAALKAEIVEGAMYPGLSNNIATAIGKYTFMEVSGTIVEPKYTIKPSAYDIMEDLADRFFQE